MDPLDMTHFHSVVRPGAATLARTPELRVLDAKSYGLALAVHGGLLLLILIGFWLRPERHPMPYIQAEIYFSNFNYPLEPPVPPAKSDEVIANDGPAIVRDHQSDAPQKGVIAAKGTPMLSTAKTEAAGAGGTGLDPASKPDKAPASAPWELSPQILRPTAPAASPDTVVTSKPPARPEAAPTTPTPAPELKQSRLVGPPADRVAPSRMGGEGVILVAPFPYYKPRPPYPRNALQNGLEGNVVVRVLVSASGVILEAKISQSSGSAMLDEAARQGVLQWKFHPGRQASSAVTTAIDVPIQFTLPDEDFPTAPSPVP